MEVRDVNPLLRPDQAGSCGGADPQNPIDNPVSEVDAGIAAAGCDSVLVADPPAPQPPRFQHVIGAKSHVKAAVVEPDAAGGLAGAIAAHPLIEIRCYGCRLRDCCRSGDQGCTEHRDGSLDWIHLVSVRNKLVGGDAPCPAGGWQLRVVTVSDFVDQFELAKASGIFHRWDVNTHLRQLQQKVWLGLRFGIKRCPWLHGEYSGLPCRNQREKQQSSRHKSAHSAGVGPEKLRSVGFNVNVRQLPERELVKVRRIGVMAWVTTEQRSGSPSA